jgi:hypothetical protein
MICMYVLYVCMYVLYVCMYVHTSSFLRSLYVEVSRMQTKFCRIARTTSKVERACYEPCEPNSFSRCDVTLPP